ncbi:hypothetical protein U1Q18_005810 [Sarracenia purpurea var. burkii]
MEDSFERLEKEKKSDSGLQIIRHPLYYQPYAKSSSPWFHLRVVYVRISNFMVNDSTPEFLTLYYIPLSPHSVLEVNGVRCAGNSDGISSFLRRDRVDKKSEEATFVSTDRVRLAGSVRFEVLDEKFMVICGVLEMSNGNGFTGGGESRSGRRWSMRCESAMTAAGGFLKGRQLVGSEPLSPAIEVYVAGSFAETPIVLTKTLKLGLPKKKKKKQNKKGMLDSIPEYETTESQSQKNGASGLDLQVGEYTNYKPESEEDYNSMNWRRTAEYMEAEDGELSWFNAGVRVGVGIGLGVCLGVGIGVGLLVRTYHATTRNFIGRFK